MRERSVPGFLPSRHGFHFANRWPPTPAFWLGAGYLHLGIGNVADGLCGGMCFVARDRLEAGEPVPDLTLPPPAGSPLFAEIVRRQVDSLDWLAGLPLRFWMLAALHPETAPQGSDSTSTARRRPAPRSTLTVRDEWPRIRAEIDAGRPAMVGLVRTASANPFRLGRNHQVMAWGYRATRDTLGLRIYDPNWPDRDDVELSVGVERRPGEPRPAIRLAQSTGEPLLAFLAAPWTPRGVRSG